MSIIGDIKSVAGDIQKIGNIQLYQKLIAIQEKIIKILDKDLELKEENLRLTKAVDLSSRLEFRDDVYWLASDKPGERGPYCPKCHDADGKLIHFIDSSVDPSIIKCPVCHIDRRKRKQ